MELIKQIDQRLDALLAKGVAGDTTLYQAARYLLLAPGKRIRPLLTYAVAEMLGNHHEEALTAGCALEMVHTYSLIHDDLPCMDDDDIRRGQPSMHKAYDEATAILVGDFLLTYAFSVLSDQIHLSDGQKVQLISCLAEAAGASGMVGGQMLDLKSSQKIESVEVLHSLKTASLFKAAFAFGAIVTGSSKPLIQTVSLIGHEFGLLFQLVDDIQDLEYPENDWTAKKLAKEKYDALMLALKSLDFNTRVIENYTDQLFKTLQKVENQDVRSPSF